MIIENNDLHNANEERLDAIDFIINVLREHENSFDSLVERLSKSIDTMEYSLGKGHIRRTEGKNKKTDPSLVKTKLLKSQIKWYKEKIRTLEKRIEELTAEVQCNEAPDES